MFEFNGHFFNAAYVVAITADESSVAIHTVGGDAPFEFAFESSADAKAKQAEAVGAWREAMALNAQP